MANIKISELNELLPGQKAYDDYLAIVDSSADETKKISVETLTSTGIKLIAVSSTAPTEFSNGDKYYNSTTNRIYEARTDVWYNPQEPVEGIFYIIFDSQNIYTYDKENETLVNVGSASGSVVNDYSTSQTNTYSCDYINGVEAFSGTEASTVTLTTSTTGYNYIEVIATGADGGYFSSGKLPLEENMLISLTTHSLRDSENTLCFWLSTLKLTNNTLVPQTGSWYYLPVGSAPGKGSGNFVNVKKVYLYK